MTGSSYSLQPAAAGRPTGQEFKRSNARDHFRANERKRLVNTADGLWAQQKRRAMGAPQTDDKVLAIGGDF
jgi:hypothetical protein